MTRQRSPGANRLLRTLTILCSIVLLLFSAAAAYVWLRHIQASVQAYRPPIRVQPRAAGHQTAPLASQVVLVVIDGLRSDAVPGMPTLSLLQQQGASARATVRAPTYAQPTWATLVTGAWPEVNGAPLVDVPEEQLGLIPADHIFAAARRANLTTALVGHTSWSSMIAHDLLDELFFSAGHDAAADQEVADTAIRFQSNFHPGLMVVHLSNVDRVAHAAGATGAAYREAVLAVDDHLRNLVDGLDLQHTVLIVVSPYGELDRGGHGGAERAVATTPFVAVGAPVIPGNYGDVALADVAPTIAAILGAPMPRLCQGSAHLNMLRCDELKRAETVVEEALQRQDYAGLYLPSIGRGPLSETSQGDVAVAVSSLEVGNLESADRLGAIAVERIDQEVARARQLRIERERRLRLPLAAAFIAVPLLVLLLRGGRRGRWLALPAAATAIGWHLLFLAQGGLYSFSGLASVQPFTLQAAQRVVAASLPGMFLILWRLIHDREGSALDVIQTSLGYSLLVIYLLGSQAAVGYWLNGLRLTWHIPDLALVFWQMAALVQITLAAATGLALPVVLLLAGLSYQGALAVNRRIRLAQGGR